MLLLTTLLTVLLLQTERDATECGVNSSSTRFYGVLTIRGSLPVQVKYLLNPSVFVLT